MPTVTRPRTPIDPAALRALTETMPLPPVPARDRMREVRDGNRY